MCIRDSIQNSGIATAMVGLLQAPPGTRLYERMKQEGRLRGDSSGDNVDGTTNIIPAMNLDALREGYKGILQHIYSPEHYYRRVRTFLHEYKPPKIRGRIRLSYILTLIRSSYRLGLVDSGRLHYWRLMLWTHFRRPRLFAEAITLAIYGYHFRKVCKRRVT